MDAVSETPGALLLCFALSQPKLSVQGATDAIGRKEYLESALKWELECGSMFASAANSLTTSGSIVYSLASLHSWMVFCPVWHSSKMIVLQAQQRGLSQSEAAEKAAELVWKELKKACEEALPRLAENATFAVAGLCQVIPSSAHNLWSTIIEFLQERLKNPLHESAQSSAALALGPSAALLHPTEWKLRSQIALDLIDQVKHSDSPAVRFSCASSLGLLFDGLLKGRYGGDDHQSTESDEEELSHSPSSRRERRQMAGDGIHFEREMATVTDMVEELLNIVVALRPVARLDVEEVIEASQLGLSLAADGGRTAGLTVAMQAGKEEPNVWAVVGIILAIAHGVMALERGRGQAGVEAIIKVLTSWLLSPRGGSQSEQEESSVRQVVGGVHTGGIALTIGASLALPAIASAAYRAELIADEEVDSILKAMERILLMGSVGDMASPSPAGGEAARAVSTEAAHLFAAACMGIGTYVDEMVREGFTVSVSRLQSIMSTMIAGCDERHLAVQRMGAMTGLCSLFGARVLGVASRRSSHGSTTLMGSSRQGARQSNMSFVAGPLLLEPALEREISGAIQRMVEIACSSRDQRIRRHSGWALAFAHSAYMAEHLPERIPLATCVGPLSSSSSSGGVSVELAHLRTLQSLPEEGALRTLTEWLVELGERARQKSSIDESTGDASKGNNDGRGNASLSKENTKRIAESVLRCLGKAPRLPLLDWVVLLKRIMRRLLRAKHYAAALFPDQEGGGGGGGEGGGTKVTAEGLGTRLRRECVKFALDCAPSFPPMVVLLDELSELTRFSVLEPTIQELLLQSLSSLVHVFSIGRSKQLFGDFRRLILDDNRERKSKHEDSGSKTNASRSSGVRGNRGGREYERSTPLFRKAAWSGLSQCLVFVKKAQADNASGEQSQLQVWTKLDGEVLSCIEALYMTLDLPSSMQTAAHESRFRQAANAVVGSEFQVVRGVVQKTNATDTGMVQEVGTAVVGTAMVGTAMDRTMEEWDAAIACLAQGQTKWTLELLKILKKSSSEAEDGLGTVSMSASLIADVSLNVAKASIARARLVAVAALPPSELMSSRTWVANLDAAAGDCYARPVMVEMARALRGVTAQHKREWVLDSIDTARMCCRPFLVIQLLALLVSSWSNHCAVLTSEPTEALKLLPLTFAELLGHEEWQTAGQLALSKLAGLLEASFAGGGSPVAPIATLLTGATLTCSQQYSRQDQRCRQVRRYDARSQPDSRLGEDAPLERGGVMSICRRPGFSDAQSSVDVVHEDLRKEEMREIAKWLAPVAVALRNRLQPDSWQRIAAVILHCNLIELDMSSRQ
ncbi:hypothetical protein CBR_g19445 [Chara braunii]|uniref:DUF3730 domain-containing protein n=1 Tax=Chara braunii TaxID=69332 RepID=A0A388KY06_CHABU|nr:hypothetical protein CBR_g19445 [Chara braunii]|eukprot:GBG74931.1 hypothetical protein CBR_g19445 [Chara braunii]